MRYVKRINSPNNKTNPVGVIREVVEEQPKWVTVRNPNGSTEEWLRKNCEFLPVKRYVKRVGEDFGKYKVGDYATLKGTVEDYDATSLDEEVELVDGSGRAAWWYKRYTKLMPEGFEPSASTPEAPVKSPERGERKNNGKNRLDLIPPEMIIALGEVLTFGANKYAARNWEKGMPLTEIAASLLRHYVAWLKGEDIDPESGKPHLWHMFTNAGFMVTISERKPQWDDRPSKVA